MVIRATDAYVGVVDMDAGGAEGTVSSITDAGELAVVPREVGDTPESWLKGMREGLLVRCEATKQTHPDHQGDPRGPP